MKIIVLINLMTACMYNYSNCHNGRWIFVRYYNWYCLISTETIYYDFRTDQLDNAVGSETKCQANYINMIHVAAAAGIRYQVSHVNITID